MSAALARACWPASQLGEALELLARESGLAGAARAAPAGAPGEAPVGEWLEAAARWHGLEAEPVGAPYPEVEAMLRGAAPALLELPGGGGVLAIVRAGRKRVWALAPDRSRVPLEVAELRDAVCAPLEAPRRDEVERMLAAAGVPEARRGRARHRIFRTMLPGRGVGGCWILRPAARDGRDPALRRRLLSRGAGLLGAHALQYALWIASWWLLGWMTLGDRLDPGLLAGWALILISLLPLRLLATWLAGVIAIDLGVALRRRLLGGILRLAPEEIRHLGSGQLLGRTLETEAVEAFAGGGALLGTMAVVELTVVAAVLAAGAGGAPHALALGAWCGVLAWVGVRYHRRRVGWTESRLQITNDLVEQMVGHRTRLVQEPSAHWGEREDRALDDYLGRSRAVDVLAVRLETLIPRGWLLVGLAALVPAFVAGAAPARIGVALGGVLLAFRSFRALSVAVEQLSGALIAARRMALFREAAARPERVGLPGLAARPPQAPAGAAPLPLLDAHALRFRHARRPDPVIRGLDLRLFPGDRLLLEGPSGGGKSTLATLLAASRTPESGLLLLDGLDLATLGERAWRRRVVFVPQFHENHVLIGTFAFNVLMGRGWPASQAELDEAERVCRALGLGPLLDRMPSGMMQMVGETGWQLSHGERSRLFIARAVLQDPELLILDESFAALDPETLRQVVEHLFERDGALMAIAHP